MNNNNNSSDSNAVAGVESEVNVVDAEEEVDVEDYDDDEEDEEEEDEEEEEDDDNRSHIENEEDDEAQTMSFTRKSKYNFNLNENMLYQEVLQVNCNSMVAELHKKKFGSGGKGHCIRLVVRKEADDTSTSSGNVIEERWMTPIEFENYCGKGNCRDWKRTIKVGGQPLLALLDARILICHAVSCSCGICNRNETLVGPIRPFMKYRRRKRDEILAQNAYKKFLSLKPPTLINDSATLITTSNNNITTSINTNSNSSLLSNSSNSSPNLTRSAFVNEHKEPHHFFPVQENGGDDLMSLMNRMKDQDEKKWSTLEQLANTLINQTKLLQTSIEQAKRESELNWKYMIDRASTTSSKRVSKKQGSKRRVSSANSINHESSM